ncbi:hypothetical protein HK100_001129 [Physocladia obscura]|uniref:Uncharacterized protein n=1 Tax=Physocladia obscura TaxID=109957 RepID=A0AAD5SZ66_9FUNG|nr:hypothetical protein HK100_001129 [Physocladia obscura]
MATNNSSAKDALETFRIKSEISVTFVRQMIDEWLPADPDLAPQPSSLSSSSNSIKSNQEKKKKPPVQ